LPARIEAAFLDGLRERGWVEGQSILLERRHAGGRADRLPELATELVRVRVDPSSSPARPPCELRRSPRVPSPSLSPEHTIPLDSAWSPAWPIQEAT
jgi:putative ABC transport system substrate-binding protein